MSLQTSLSQIIAQQIREGGPISFRDFMEMALYHPEWGYYNRPHANLGKEGDFFTSPQVGALFGWTLGRAIEAWIKERPPINARHSKKASTEPVSIVEFGAGKGFLAWDILEYFKHQAPSLLDRIQYQIIEQSSPFRRFQKDLFSRDRVLKARVQWAAEEELGPFRGVVLANEFIDALPFHRVMLTHDGYREIYVNLVDDRWVETTGPFSTPRLAEILKGVEEDYSAASETSWDWNQVIEISVEAVDWIARLGALMTEGVALIIDYGEEVGRLYAGTPGGMARAFHQHRVTDRMFEHIGEQDITASVNFTLLQRAAVAQGFEVETFLTQADFLMRHDIMAVVEEREKRLSLDGEGARNARRQVLNLILPEMMGTSFKCLVLRRR